MFVKFNIPVTVLATALCLGGGSVSAAPADLSAPGSAHAFDLRPPRRDNPQSGTSTSYVFILPNDDRVEELAQPLIDWRLKQGFTVHSILVQQHNTSEYLQNQIRVINQNSKPVEYVLLLGDTGGEFAVPVFNQGLSDFPYGLLTGNDHIPEAAVGRLSFNTLPELERMVEKILRYELEPEFENWDWTRRAAVCAGNRISGLSTILVSRWARDALLRSGFDAVDTLWWDMNSTVASFMRDQFNAENALITYRGWTGLENWAPEDAAALNNTVLPFALLLGCNTGDFRNIGAGFTEALLRARGGAIGAAGNAGSQSRVQYNNALLAAFIRAYLDQPHLTQGWLLNAAKQGMLATYEAVEPERLSDHCYYINLMGDPATPLWHEEPREVQLEAPEQIPIGPGLIQVQVTDGMDNPVSGVRVGVYKPDQIGEFACSDDDGVALVSFDPPGVTAGEVSISVSGAGVLPLESGTRLVPSQRYLLFVGAIVRDNNNFPLMGNNDSIVNPNEVVELGVQVRNIGVEAIPGRIQFDLETASPFCEIDLDQYSLQNDIGSGLVAVALFRVSITSDYPDAEDIPFGLTAASGDDEWVMEFSIAGQAPRLEFAGTSLENLPRPGQISQFDINIFNRGSLTASGVSAELTSPSQLVEIIGNIGWYDSLFHGEAVWSGIDTFNVHFDDFAPPGAAIPFVLNLESDENYTARVPFELTIQPQEEDEEVVTGPDAYGYWAIESFDAISNLAPRFVWMELNPARNGQGTNTGILDNGEDNDASVVVELPFTFVYYGREYDRLTICSNGWAALGDQAEYVDFRNLPIGTPQGPRAQICPWWDDLYQPGEQGNIFYFYHESQHRFIVQWDEMRRWVGPGGPGASETFQLILNDPAWHPTTTGDGDVVFQYMAISHESRVDGNGTPYATIGIGNPEDDGGLQLGFWNRWVESVEAPASRTAIRFATARQHDYAMLEGVVRNTADDQPLEGVTVNVTPGGWYVTAADGIFRVVNTIAAAPLQVNVSAPGFNTVTMQHNAIAVGDSDSVVVSLTKPELTLDTQGFVDTLQNQDEVRHQFTMTNRGNGPLSFDLSFDTPLDDARRDDADGIWESLFTLDASALTGDQRILGAAFLDNRLAVSGAGDGINGNYIYIFDRQGRLQNRLSQPVASFWGMHDLAWDGQFIYGGGERTIYRWDLAERIESIPSPLIPPRALAVDPETGDIWVANAGEPLYKLNAAGEVLASYRHRLNIYGLAWHPAEGASGALFAWSYDGPTHLALSRFNPVTASFEGVANLEFVEGDRPGGAEFTSDWNRSLWTLCVVLQNPNGDRVEILNAGVYLDWLEVAPQSGEIPAEGSRQVQLTLHTGDLTPGWHEADLVISHNADGGELRLPIRVGYNLGADSDLDGIPAEFSLDPLFPNPANSFVSIGFSLPQAGSIHLELVDLQGRVVKTLESGHYSAGSHLFSLNSDGMASGLYLVRLSGTQGTLIRKMALLK